MLQELAYDKNVALDYLDSYPCVSIILPFEPKMSLHRELEYKLSRVCKQVENEMRKTYSSETLTPVRDKLEALIRHIDFTSFKKECCDFCISCRWENLLSRYSGRRESGHR